MDGLFRCLTVPVGVTLAGRDFAIHPLTLAGFAQVELHLMAGRRSPIDDAAGQPECVQQAAMDEVKADRSQRVIRLTDLYRWLDCREGLAFTGWLCLQCHGRAAFPTLTAAQRFFTSLTLAERLEFVRRRDMASGMDLLAGLDWPGSPSGETSTFVNWKRIFRWFAESFQWTPEQVGKLTLHQVRLYRAPENQLGGRARMSPAEAMAYVNRSKGSAAAGNLARTRDIARARMRDNFRKRTGR